MLNRDSGTGTHNRGINCRTASLPLVYRDFMFKKFACIFWFRDRIIYFAFICWRKWMHCNSASSYFFVSTWMWVITRPLQFHWIQTFRQDKKNINFHNMRGAASLYCNRFCTRRRNLSVDEFLCLCVSDATYHDEGLEGIPRSHSAKRLSLL